MTGAAVRTMAVVRLSAVMHGITDLSLREVGDITFAFYNSKVWRGAERWRWRYMNPPDTIVSAAGLLLKELACIKKMTCLLLVGKEKNNLSLLWLIY